MRKRTGLLLILICTYGYMHAWNEKKENDTVAVKGIDIKELEEYQVIIEEDEPSVQAWDYTPDRNYNRLLADSVKRILAVDPLFEDSLSGLKGQGMHIVESADKRIRIVSWTEHRNEYDSREFYYNIVQYYIADGKTRFAYFGKDYYLYDNHSFMGYKHNVRVSKIHHLHNGIYIFEGVDKSDDGGEYKLIGVDIGRGVLKDAYLFSDGGNSTSSTFSLPLCTDSLHKSECVLNNWHLQIPETDDDGCPASGYSDYYFNGSFFSSAESYVKLLPDIIAYRDMILRLYYKDGDNMKVITSTYPSAGITLVADVGLVKGRDLKDIVYKITLKSTEDDEHESGRPFVHSLLLKPINNSVFIENIVPYYLPVDTITVTENNELSQVTYTAGKEEALSYEWLRYTAVAFNCQPTEEDCQRILWGIEVGGELQLLDNVMYRGTQIDLQMKEEWIGQEILVIPYIEGCEINARAAIKTSVVADE